MKYHLMTIATLIVIVLCFTFIDQFIVGVLRGLLLVFGLFAASIAYRGTYLIVTFVAELVHDYIIVRKQRS